MNPHCGLGACGMGRWKLVMKINGSKVIINDLNSILKKKSCESSCRNVS